MQAIELTNTFPAGAVAEIFSDEQKVGTGTFDGTKWKLSSTSDIPNNLIPKNAIFFTTQAKPKKNFLIGSLGDSRMNNAGHDGTSENVGPLHFACVLAEQRLSFRTKYNFSVGGINSQDIIDTYLTPACESEPSSFLVLTGTNDRVNMTVAQTIANIETIVSRLIEAGKDVYLLAELPRGNSSYPTYRLSAAQLKAHYEVREWILSQTGRPNLYVIDAFSRVGVRTSTTGDIRLDCTIDGLHPNTLCSYEIGDEIAKAIKANYPVAPSILPAQNYVGGVWLTANPMLDGTGGTFGVGGSGSMAAGFSAGHGSTVGGITQLYSKTTEGYQQIVLGGTAASGSNPQLDLLRQTGLQSIIPAGTYVEAIAEIQAMSGITNISSIQVGIMVVKADASIEYVWDGDRYTSTATSTLPSTGIKGVWRSEPILVPAGATDVRLLFRVYGVNSSASSGTIIVKSLGLRTSTN